jgi:hypothetical protein
MNRDAFEHVVRAAADVVDDDLVVIGSQAVLGQVPDPAPELLRSMELDVYPRTHGDRADLIDGSLGDGSLFHATFDYYAHAVDPETAVRVAGWEDRLVPVEIPSLGARRQRIVAWCLDVHDLVLAKLAAGRPQDLDYAEEAIRASLVDVEVLAQRLELVAERDQSAVGEHLAGAITRARRGRP